jgi:hypothetical protein
MHGTKATTKKGRWRLSVAVSRARAVFKTWRRRIGAAREARRAFADPRVPPVLIYRMGKVGSQSIVASLRAAKIPQHVLAVHFLSGDVDRVRGLREQNRTSAVPYHLLLGAAVGKSVRENPGRPCRIITLVRDPVAFVVSNLFERADRVGDIQSHGGHVDPEKAHRHLDDKFRRLGGTNYMNNWFDRELKRVFGIDVFTEPFPVDRGYAVFKNGPVEALVLRLEDLSEVGPQVLADFLELDEPLRLVRRNCRDDSRDGAAYEQVLSRLRLNESTCRGIYGCRIARHFYSEELIERFVLKWTRPSDRRPTSGHREAA